MADRLVADVVADDEIVGAVNGDPTIVAVPDRAALDVAAAHGVAGEMKVDGVATEDVFLAEMTELGVAEAARGTVVIHRVAAHLKIGRFDDDVAAEIRDFRAIVAGAEVVERERLGEGQRDLVDLGDDAFFGVDVLVAIDGTTRAACVVGALSGGDEDLVADLPTGDRLIERDGGRALLRRRVEADPGARHRRTVNIHASAAADDGGPGEFVGAFDVMEADQGLLVGGDRLVGSADFEGCAGGSGYRFHHVAVAIEAVLAELVSRFDAEEADVEFGVAVLGERQRAGDMQDADHFLRDDVVRDLGAGRDQDARARGGDLSAVPSSRRGPGAGVRRANGGGLCEEVGRQEQRRREGEESRRGHRSLHRMWTKAGVEAGGNILRHRCDLIELIDDVAAIRVNASRIMRGCGRRFRIGARDGEAPAEPRTRESQ